MTKRTALITGASAGIGAAFAEVFASEAFDVVLIARREDRLNALASRLRDTYGIRADVIVADLGEPQAPDRIVEALAARGVAPVAIATSQEYNVIDALLKESSVRIVSFELPLPEVAALAARSQIFVGNDSGIAHIAAAVGTRSVVIFGSSNVAHWRPWNKAAAEVVLEEMPCQPCHGYFCEKFPQPECILRVPVERVLAAIDKTLRNAN